MEFVLSGASPPSLQDVADALLKEGADDDGPWLVSIPLANVALDRLWVPLDERAALWRKPEAHRIENRDDAEEAERAEIAAEFEIFHHLGDRLRPPSRTLHLGGKDVDTGRTVSLLIVESGSPLIAIEAARAKAQYAVATWSVLAPPTGWHLMPDLGIWTPQPCLHQSTVYKRLEPGEWIGREPRRGGAYRIWSPFELPRDDLLTAPFEAFKHLDRRPPHALLSGTAALHSGTRATRSQLSERIRDVRAAIECLCEPPPGASGSARQRWERLAQRFQVWDRIAYARAYTAAQLTDLQNRLVDARNISTHGADAALIDLGWTAGDRPLRGGRRAPATDLAVTALQRDLGPMLHAVREALQGTWSAMRDVAFDQAAFEALFSA